MEKHRYTKREKSEGLKKTSRKWQLGTQPHTDDMNNKRVVHNDLEQKITSHIIRHFSNLGTM